MCLFVAIFMETQNVDELWLKALCELNEVQRRRFAALKAIALGWGGISKVCKLTGMSNHTIDKGMQEVTNLQREPTTRLRKPGAGRKKITQKKPEIKDRIEAILDENTQGDPMSLLKWTSKSTYAVAEELGNLNLPVSEDTVGRIIKQLGYSLQANRKSKESSNVAGRDSQFRYINEQSKSFSQRNLPVISVDAKKKELVGNFKNSGRRWQRKGEADVVNVYDFEYLAEGKAVPYGVYDVGWNSGFVNVGVSSDTSEFAVESIRQWWKNIGALNYLGVGELLICADCGGSYSRRSRLWKFYLNRFALESGLRVSVCHYPPGTSKWNKIEYRMFSFISVNWCGKPLRSYEIVLNLIRATTTRMGLWVAAGVDRKICRSGEKISEVEFAKINIEHRAVNPDWNYTIN